MRIFSVEATGWKRPLDFYYGVSDALHGEPGYSHSVDSLLELMLWDEVEELKPPYVLRITGTANLPQRVADEIQLMKHYLADACTEYRARNGRDVFVGIETTP